jgi:L-iditol 2-dehydrogenase
MAPSVIFDTPSSDVGPTKTTSQTTNGTSGKKTLSVLLPNPSLQVTADHNLKQENAPVYAPAHGEVLLHIKATGVCG